ncbi:MAG TPA: hypothetical protein VJT32_04135 [bacterium]|nr:hypothetical protein [bacterium]
MTTPLIIESWRIVDRWWTDDAIEIEYIEVQWGERKLVFKRTKTDQTWRIVGGSNV